MIYEWAKVWTDILGDPKLMRAARKGAKGLELLPWFITFAKKEDDGGRLTVGGEPAEPADFVPLIPRQTLRSIAAALKSLLALDILVEDEDGALRFTAWESRQQKPGEGTSPSENNRGAYVYYARDGDVVKIGYSRNPWARCVDLRAHRPGLKLLAVESGDFALERQRQAELGGRTDFRNNRPGSEWFPWTPAVEAFIAQLIASKPAASGGHTTGRTTEHTTGSTTPPELPSQTTKEERRVEQVREEQSTSPSPPPRGIERLREALPEEYRTDLDALLARVPDPAAWCGELAMCVEGGTAGASVTYEDLGRALRDFRLNRPAESPEIALFRAYVKRAAADRRQSVRTGLPRPAANGQNRSQVPAAAATTTLRRVL